MIFTILLCLFSTSFAATKVELEGGFRGESNAYYRDREKIMDFAAFIKPSILLEKETKATLSSVHFLSEYSKYAGNSNLDHLDYSTILKTTLNTRGRWLWTPSLYYNFQTEPPESKVGERLEKTEIAPSLKLTFKKNDRKTHSLELYSLLTSFDLSSLAYAENAKVGAIYEYEYYFLPETAFLFLAEAENSTFPRGLENLEADPGTTRYLYDNNYAAVKVGLRGRLTEHTFVHLIFGYALRLYEEETSFNEPVFEVRFQEQITPQDILMAGYIYKVEDSFYTNYSLNQHMYIGYSRVFGDRFIVYFRSDYIYKSYSLPNRREDQRLAGILRVDMSYRPNWVIQAGLSGDFLISDSIDQTSTNVVDPAASYQAIQAFIGSKFSF